MNNNLKEINKKIQNSPNSKAIKFFIFYAIFFLFLLLFMKTSEFRTNTNNNKKIQYKLDNIMNENYHFKYNIILDNDTYEYEGDKLKEQESFIYSENNTLKKYYRNNEIFKVKDISNWIETTNPYILSEFYNKDNINSIINTSTNISKTRYESGKNVYHNEISTTSLVKIIENIDIDLDDLPNKIDIKVNEYNEVESIKYYLDNYSLYKNNNNCTIDLEYSNFNNIEKINTPE